MFTAAELAVLKHGDRLLDKPSSKRRADSRIGLLLSCPCCGTEFRVRPEQSRKKFCHDTCMKKAWRRAKLGLPIDDESNRTSYRRAARGSRSAR